MKLKEVCEKTGLTKRTVRFYEEKALFVPHKHYMNGREYREYSEEDVERLNDIATLRRARFSIQEIQEMEDRPETLANLFSGYLGGLYQQKKELEGLIAAAESVDPEKLNTVGELIQLLRDAASNLPLPVTDIRPHFRYLDEQESSYGVLQRKKQRKDGKRRENLRIGVNTAVSGAVYQKGNPRSLELGNEQKLAVMQMLRDD